MSDKALNKNERFVCEVLWGGVPVDHKWVRDNKLFQEKRKEFEDYEEDGHKGGSWFSTHTKSNRAKSQVLFLLDLVGNSYESLFDLELLLRYNHVHYCPGDKEEVSKVFRTCKHRPMGKW